MEGVAICSSYYNTVTILYSNPPTYIYAKNVPTRISDIALYDSSNNSWRKVDSLTNDKIGIGASLINNNTMIILGGILKEEILRQPCHLPLL